MSRSASARRALGPSPLRNLYVPGDSPPDSPFNSPPRPPRNPINSPLRKPHNPNFDGEKFLSLQDYITSLKAQLSKSDKAMIKLTRGIDRSRQKKMSYSHGTYRRFLFTIAGQERKLKLKFDHYQQLEWQKGLDKRAETQINQKVVEELERVTVERDRLLNDEAWRQEQKQAQENVQPAQRASMIIEKENLQSSGERPPNRGNRIWRTPTERWPGLSQ